MAKKTNAVAVAFNWNHSQQIEADGIKLSVQSHQPVTRDIAPAASQSDIEVAALCQAYCAVEFGIKGLESNNAQRARDICGFAIDAKSYKAVGEIFKNHYAAQQAHKGIKAQSDDARKARNNAWSRVCKAAEKLGWNKGACASQSKRAVAARQTRAAASAGKTDGRSTAGKAAAGKAAAGKAAALPQKALVAVTTAVENDGELRAVVRRAAADAEFRTALLAWFHAQPTQGTALKKAA